MSDAQLERTVLGAMLLRAESFSIGRDLKPADFYLDSHRRIFLRLLAMGEAGFQPDESSLVSELTRTGELEVVGDIGYVLSLTEGVPRGSWTPVTPIALLRKAAMRRRIVAIAQLALARAETGDDPEEILAEISNAALSSQIDVAQVRPRWLAEFAMPILEELREQRNQTGTVA